MGSGSVAAERATEGARITAPDAPLRLTVGGRRWTVPRACVVGVTEAETPTPLPPALLVGLPGLVGVVGVNGEPVACADPVGDGGDGPGRMLVVVTTAVGRVALRVDDARWEREGGAEPLALAAQLPWCGGARVADPGAPRPMSMAAGAPSDWPLLRVIHDGAALTVRADRLERIERAELVAPLPESAGWLVAVDGALLPARCLSGPTLRRGEHGAEDNGTEDSGAVHAVVLRGDRPGERAALLVERVVSVERGPAAALFTVRHPEGGESLWWRGREGAPLRVVDPAPLFGWAAAVFPAPEAPPTDRTPTKGSPAVEAGRCLFVERAGVTLAVPLALLARVAEADHDGPADRLRLVGPGRWRRRALRVDRINALPGGPGGGSPDDAASPWRPIDGLPPALAALFDAARRDPAGDRWILRVRPVAGSVADTPGLPLPVAARRCLVAAWRTWVAPPPAPPATAPACATPSSVSVAPKPSVIASS